MGDDPYPAGDDDAAVIARSRSEPHAFAAIFDRHFAAIHGYLARRAGAALADDLASSTFTVAFDRRGTFRAGADSARPWLYGIATNLLRNERRAEQRALETIARLVPAAAADLFDEPRIDGLSARLATVLAELDGDQRDVLLLHAWAELSYEEIAASLGIPIGTVRSRLARARAFVKSRLEAAEPAGVLAEEER